MELSLAETLLMLRACDCNFARAAADGTLPGEGFEKVPDCGKRVTAVAAPRSVDVAVAVDNGLPKSL
jgi:hypothetical protein